MKICPKCNETYDESFVSCFECSKRGEAVELVANHVGATPEPTRAQLWVGLIACVIAATYFHFLPSDVAIIGFLLFSGLAIFAAFQLFIWIRITLLVGLCLWGVGSAIAGLFAMSTTNFLLLLILLHLWTQQKNKS